ncbi:MAG: DegT/DnrJ/EryC1/StrS family aminotransferase [Oscillibacter sp.]|nr:DegT/DnrJ/EryC1/StrS family aminotransferase [Oscillibacter sp.]
MPPYEEFCEEIRDLWDSRILTHSGAKHEKLCAELKDYLGVDNFCLFANGHLALEIIIEAMGLTGEIITTPFTFASTTQAIARNGLTPVFCDIDPEDLTIDVDKIESLITERTSAILPVHVYGNLCNERAIREIADRHGLKVIYDAAHAFGETADGVGVGNWGDASMFSFHATKVFHTVEGGGVAFHDAALDPILRQIRQFGQLGKENAVRVGTNAKMTEMHAAMGLCNLRHIDEEIAKRKRAVERYRERLGGIPGIKLYLAEKEGVKGNYAYFPVYFDAAALGFSRDDAAAALERENVFARKYFYPLTSDFDVYRGRFEIQKTPVASRIADGILTLPLYADITQADVDRICGILVSAIK